MLSACPQSHTLTHSAYSIHTHHRECLAASMGIGTQQGLDLSPWRAPGILTIPPSPTLARVPYPFWKQSQSKRGMSRWHSCPNPAHGACLQISCVKTQPCLLPGHHLWLFTQKVELNCSDRLANHRPQNILCLGQGRCLSLYNVAIEAWGPGLDL